MLRAAFLLLAPFFAVLAGEPLVAVVNPASPLRSISRETCARILRGDLSFLEGRRLTLVLTKPSTPSLPAVIYGLFRESPQAYMMRIKAAKLRGENLDPQFQDSPQGLLASVASNAGAVGFLAARDARGEGVRILPVPD